ncbi:Glycosyltransferase Gtf1 [Roseivivax sp. THAF40]|uniref:glycosyltransferase n=1 Tax=unclassified Roseivivax TaxID=2639302 RepID=UPI001267D525|nr:MULTISPECIES: glycosyltransferase [unclassified Roseivivax]QFS83194.1 Glycosyltransferase Gtf1 [Roseivivax sp. THAF197b]QFT46938.1 Glycosyltransferase Gtf1 [Roseivivax sp. THAF40]
MTAPRLLMIAPAPVIRGSRGITLDRKFVEGMRHHVASWPGSVAVLLREGAGNIPFGAMEIDPASEPYDLRIIAAHAPVTARDVDGADLLLCSADDDRNFGVEAVAASCGIPLVASLEYTLETRLRIAALDTTKSSPRRALSALRIAWRDRKRRALLSGAAALQANGYPAHALCRRFDPQALLYLDNRMTADLFASPEDQSARHARLMSGAPLRLVYSGRLEPMKGAQDLAPVATALLARNIPFTLDIFGAGSLRGRIADQIAQGGLEDHVTLHDPVDFATELVPWLRRNADIYLCCHRQSDPSCTYLENMGCGLAVAGYANGMWAALAKASRAGRASALGDVSALAAEVAAFDADREGLIQASKNAHDFARGHDVETEFRARMEHLAGLAGQGASR